MGSLECDIINQPVEIMKMLVPAGLYSRTTACRTTWPTLQSHLDGPSCQLLYQLNIFTTAMFSVLVLGRSLARHQCASLVLLELT